MKKATWGEQKRLASGSNLRNRFFRLISGRVVMILLEMQIYSNSQIGSRCDANACAWQAHAACKQVRPAMAGRYPMLMPTSFLACTYGTYVPTLGVLIII